MSKAEEARDAFFEGVRFGRSAKARTFWEEVEEEEGAWRYYQEHKNDD